MDANIIEMFIRDEQAKADDLATKKEQKRQNNIKNLRTSIKKFITENKITFLSDEQINNDDYIIGQSAEYGPIICIPIVGYKANGVVLPDFSAKVMFQKGSSILVNMVLYTEEQGDNISPVSLYQNSDSSTNISKMSEFFFAVYNRAKYLHKKQIESAKTALHLNGHSNDSISFFGENSEHLAKEAHESLIRLAPEEKKTWDKALESFLANRQAALAEREKAGQQMKEADRARAENKQARIDAFIKARDEAQKQLDEIRHHNLEIIKSIQSRLDAGLFYHATLYYGVIAQDGDDGNSIIEMNKEVGWRSAADVSIKDGEYFNLLSSGRFRNEPPKRRTFKNISGIGEIEVAVPSNSRWAITYYLNLDDDDFCLTEDELEIKMSPFEWSSEAEAVLRAEFEFKLNRIPADLVFPTLRDYNLKSSDLSQRGIEVCDDEDVPF